LSDSGALGLGTLRELDWRHTQELALDKLLKEHGLGECDGGQGGAGTMEIFLYVSDVEQAVKLVRQYLTDQELIGFCKIASQEAGQQWTVHYPAGTEFSFWEF